MPTERITHQQIAERAGVSRGLVTAALHRTRGQHINAATRENILEIARQLNYRPQNVTTHSIGIVTPVESLMLEGEMAFLVAVNKALRAHKYRLTLVGLDADDLPSLPDAVNPKTVDGVLMTNWYGGNFQELIPPEIPWVLTADEYQFAGGVDEEMDIVTVDIGRTVRDVTEYLLGSGHERICLVSGLEGVGFHERMKQAVQEAMQAHNLTADNYYPIMAPHDEDIAEPLIAMMQRANRPTAIIAGSSEKAMTVLYLLRISGFDVPADVSIVSLFDSRRLITTQPKLTATTAYGTEVAERAVKRLLEKIERPASRAEKIYMPGTLIERNSVRAVS